MFVTFFLAIFVSIAFSLVDWSKAVAEVAQPVPSALLAKKVNKPGKKKKQVKRSEDEEVESETAERAVPEKYRYKMASGSYVAGGIVGTVAGFGIGHAVQGRWLHRGWIFTASELIGVGIYAHGAIELGKCIDENNELYEEDSQNDGEDTEKRNCTNEYFGQILLGLSAMIGFHVWEIVDVWAIPKKKNDGNYYIVEESGTLRIGLAPYKTEDKILPSLTLAMRL